MLKRIILTIALFMLVPGVGWTEDFEGNPMCDGPDIGAYEFQKYTIGVFSSGVTMN